MISVPPSSKSTPVVVKRQLVDSSARIALQTSWEFMDIDESVVRKQEEVWDQTILDQLTAKSDLLSSISVTETRQAIEGKCGETGFLDVEFPPLSRFLYKGDEEEENSRDSKLLSFRRCSDYSRDNAKNDASAPSPSVLTSRLDASDIVLGLIPDSWLITSLASLTANPATENLIKSLFPEDFQSYSAAGVYIVRLFKNGEWITVLLDDFFPCFPKGGPAYSTTHSGALWVQLVEKAFAKVHGGYKNIAVGAPYEAMIDLTGAPAVCLHFDDEEVEEQINDGSLWKLMTLYAAKGYVMTVSVAAEDEGHTELSSGHAFTIESLKSTSLGCQLIVLHNPWRSLQWTGNWNPSSKLWTNSIKEELGITSIDDKLVYMEFSDLVTFFSCLNICMVRTALNTIVPWKTTSRRLKFTYSEESGQVSNELFSLFVDAESSVFLTVHQQDEHIANGKPYIDIGVTVLLLKVVFCSKTTVFP